MGGFVGGVGTGCFGGFTTAGVILVLFILLVIVLTGMGFGI